jgi:hypothetical protein
MNRWKQQLMLLFFVNGGFTDQWVLILKTVSVCHKLAKTTSQRGVQHFRGRLCCKYNVMCRFHGIVFCSFKFTP